MIALEEHRIEQMRSAVMAAVDEDVRRRGRRTRIVARTAAALCVLAVVAAVGTQLTGGHDRPASSSTAAGSALTPPSASSVPSAAPAPPVRNSQSGLSASVATGAKAPASAGRSIVSTGSARLVTSKPLSTADAFMGWAGASGGYVAGQTGGGSGRDAHMTLTVRVPDQEAAITRLRTLGKLDQVHTDAQDVTTQATDLDARIKEARISIARLEDILGNTTSVRDVLTAESALTSRQQELESMVEQRKNLSDQVALATLTVTFTGPQGDHVAHHHDWFHRTVTGSLHTFGVGVRAVLTVIAFLLPWLVLAAVLSLIGGGILRGVRRRRSRARPATEDLPGSP